MATNKRPINEDPIQPVIPDPSPDLLAEMANEPGHRTAPLPPSQMSPEAKTIQDRLTGLGGDPNVSHEDFQTWHDDPFVASQRKERQRLADQQSQIDRMDSEAEFQRQEDQDQFTRNMVHSGQYPDYMHPRHDEARERMRELEGMRAERRRDHLTGNPLELHNLATQRHPFAMEHLAGQMQREISEMGVSPEDAFARNFGEHGISQDEVDMDQLSKGIYEAPEQPEQQEDPQKVMDRTRRKNVAEAKKSAQKQIRAERMRARRGLGPLPGNEEARRAVDAGTGAEYVRGKSSEEEAKEITLPDPPAQAEEKPQTALDQQRELGEQFGVGPKKDSGPLSAAEQQRALGERFGVGGSLDGRQFHREPLMRGPDGKPVEPDWSRLQRMPRTIRRGSGGGSERGLPEDQMDGGSRYQTGQSHQFDSPLSSGRTSTNVYALPGGIGLPDGQGMSNEEFAEAFEKMNPGKTMQEAIEDIAMEGGWTGNAAKKLIKNIQGANGAGGLSASQREQAMQQIADQGAYLLREHAQAQGQQIGAAASSLRKAEDNRRKAIEKRRRDAASAAIEEYDKMAADTDSYSALPNREQFIKRRMNEIISTESEIDMLGKGMQYPEESAMSWAARISQGSAPATSPVSSSMAGQRTMTPGGPATAARTGSGQTQFIPDSALTNGARIADNGSLVFDIPGMQSPMQGQLITESDGDTRVVPVVTSKAQEDMLPSGSTFVHGRTGEIQTVTRQGKNAGTTEKSGAQEEETFEPDTEKARSRIAAKRRIELRDDLAEAESSMKELAELVNSGRTTPQVEERYRQAQERLASLNSQMYDISNADLSAELGIMRSEFDQNESVRQDYLLDQGDPVETTRRINEQFGGQFGYSNGKRVYRVNNVDIAVRDVGGYSVPDPQTAHQARALGFGRGSLAGDASGIPSALRTDEKDRSGEFEIMKERATKENFPSELTINYGMKAIKRMYPNMPQSQLVLTLDAMLEEAGFDPNLEEKQAGAFIGNLMANPSYSGLMGAFQSAQDVLPIQPGQEKTHQEKEEERIRNMSPEELRELQRRRDEMRARHADRARREQEGFGAWLNETILGQNWRTEI